MIAALSPLWDLLEAAFPIGGPRGHLRDRLGDDCVAALERIGALRQLRVADRYPCPQPGGDGCPRVVVETEDGAAQAVCGNVPAQCSDRLLSSEDVAFLGLVPEALLERIRLVLSLKGKVEPLDGLPAAYRVGTFIPEPGVKHPIYFLVQHDESGYAACIDDIRRRAHGPCGVLIPTGTFVGDEFIAGLERDGTVLLALRDAFALDGAGALVTDVDPLKAFAHVGRVRQGERTIARGLVCERGGKPQWLNVDDAIRAELMAIVDRFDILADEATRTVVKAAPRSKRTTRQVPVSYFQTIRAAVESNTFFDPAVEGPHEERADGKQTFQRARQAFDLRTGKNRDSPWAIFKTEKRDEHAVYRFDPVSTISFCFLFSPDD